MISMHFSQKIIRTFLSTLNMWNVITFHCLPSLRCAFIRFSLKKYFQSLKCIKSIFKPHVNLYHIINNDNFFIFINDIIVESLLIAISWSSKSSSTWSFNNLYFLFTIMSHLLTLILIRMKSMKRGLLIF
jgi:hypothetical protein